MKLKSAVKILFFSSLILLSGCVTKQTLQPVKNPQLTWKSYAKQLYANNHWAASGEIGIRNGNQAISANFSWQQNGNQFVIQLSGPLNLGSKILQGRPGLISLNLGDNQIVQADNAEDLMQQQLGWSMPVEGLTFWIRALPIYNVAYQPRLNANGTLASLMQQNWLITYQSYMLEKGLPLPHKLVMQQGPWRIVIVVNAWTYK